MAHLSMSARPASPGWGWSNRGHVGDPGGLGPSPDCVVARCPATRLPRFHWVDACKMGLRALGPLSISLWALSQGAEQPEWHYMQQERPLGSTLKPPELFFLDLTAEALLKYSFCLVVVTLGLLTIATAVFYVSQCCELPRATARGGGAPGEESSWEMLYGLPPPSDTRVYKEEVFPPPQVRLNPLSWEGAAEPGGAP